ncbi:MAG: hypothetical protein IJ071_10700, partial [Ruminococcus sp.]|nr:hypothetical protein [Ruminococcus sp.]
GVQRQSLWSLITAFREKRNKNVGASARGELKNSPADSFSRGDALQDKQRPRSLIWLAMLYALAESVPFHRSIR